MPPPITVLETQPFVSAARRLLSDVDRAALIDHLAYDPLVGDVIVGAGGLRKLRWRMEGRGKRGGARVIYYVHDTRIPLFLLTAYAKNEQDDLSAAEKAEFRKMTEALVAYFTRKS